MKRLMITILAMVFVLCTGCGQNRTNHFYGDYIDVDTTNKDVSYIRSYLIMDCCKKWNDIQMALNTVIDVSSAEGFEYYCYDQNMQVITGSDNVIMFHPTEDFQNKPYEDIMIIHYDTFKVIDHEITENGDIKAYAGSLDGIFLYVKKIKGSIPANIWVSNIDDCNGQCRTCSDDW